MSDDTMYVVAIDTRGIPSGDLNEGYEELTCSREYFNNHIQGHKNTVCMPCFIADCCGLKKHLTLYFHEYIVETTRKGAWNSFFPIEENNPGASLLTMDLESGYPTYNVQGVAYAIYDNGHYPISREQVWGIVEMANEAKDIYFLREEHGHRGIEELSRWCRQYRDRQWGPKSIYEPRQLRDEDTDEYHHHRHHHTTSSKNPKKTVGRLILI